MSWSKENALDQLQVCIDTAPARDGIGELFVSEMSWFFPTESLQLFGFEDDHSFGVLRSSVHWTWAVGVGLPAHLDPKDSRWFSTDCIESPPVGS